MNDSKTSSSVSTLRQQQQPRRIMDRQQQQSSGSNEFQPKQPQAGGDRSRGGQMGQAG